MALPIYEQQYRMLNDLITELLWTKTVDGQNIKRRRLVARDRLAASFSMGGLQIYDPEQMVAGLQMNL